MNKTLLILVLIISPKIYLMDYTITPTEKMDNTVTVDNERFEIVGNDDGYIYEDNEIVEDEFN